jgi:hypothetical protein
MYCRVEYAINEGAVGGTGYVGGIAGYYWSAVKPSEETEERTAAARVEIAHRGGMEFCRNTGDIYALESATTTVGSIVGMPRMFTYSANEDNEIAAYITNHGPWPVGVKNCYVGGSVWYNTAEVRKVDATNYMNAIYSDRWIDEFVSITNKPYDGCTLYVPAVEEPEGGEGEGEEPEAEPTAKR